MYHVELRQFPHSVCRFNLSERDLRDTVLDAWGRGEWVELGERKWNPQQAKLTVLEGPQLDVQQLAMGRGWRNAQRQGRDVTERLLAGDRQTTDRVFTGEVATEADERRALVEALALEVMRLLGSEPVPLIRAWIEQRQRHPECTPGECLTLAEAAVRQ